MIEKFVCLFTTLLMSMFISSGIANATPISLFPNLNVGSINPAIIFGDGAITVADSTTDINGNLVFGPSGLAGDPFVIIQANPGGTAGFAIILPTDTPAGSLISFDSRLLPGNEGADCASLMYRGAGVRDTVPLACSDNAGTEWIQTTYATLALLDQSNAGEQAVKTFLFVQLNGDLNGDGSAQFLVSDLRFERNDGSSIPEPSSFALAFLALGLLARSRRVTGIA